MYVGVTPAILPHRIPAVAWFPVSGAVSTPGRARRGPPTRRWPLLAECLTCEAGWLAEIDLPGEALAAVHEATGICQDQLPWQQRPSCAAPAMILEGELLCEQGRHRQAVWLLAQGWHLATGQEDVQRDAVPAIRAAYRADPDHFSAVWQAETGAEPPDWLST
jgi:hypothetical protein